MSEREYVRKPERVTAVQWNKPGDHPDVEPAGDSRDGKQWFVLEQLLPAYKLTSISLGDWIIEHPDGTRSAMSDANLRRTYRPADDAREGDAMRLLRRLAGESPWAESYMGEVSCHYCGADDHKSKAHEPDCPWDAAKRLTGAKSHG